MENKKFWTLRPDGTEVLRDLKKENESFNLESYNNGEFDANNYQWFEMFHHYSFDDNGCDYERKGCFIKEGDVIMLNDEANKVYSEKYIINQINRNLKYDQSMSITAYRVREASAGAE
jgi:hypothetical protein